MAKKIQAETGEAVVVNGTPVVIQVRSMGAWRAIAFWLAVILLIASVAVNVVLWKQLSSAVLGVNEKVVAGEESATQKIAIIRFTGTISPPFTDRWMKQIKRAQEDESVRAVLLSIDSPGGLVSDSHTLYRELQKLAEDKPIYVSMKRIAASGGLYVAMSGGTESQIFVEPTTWTGSIGVIIPRYNASGLTEKIGVESDSLKTGPLKDSLNPFRDLSDLDKEVWGEILDDAFGRFIGVIADNRPSLSETDVRKLATGQIYTATQAVENGIADQFGYEEDAIEALAEKAGLAEGSYSAVEYSAPQAWLDMVVSSAEAPSSPLEELLDSSVPRAMYYCSWNPFVGR